MDEHLRYWSQIWCMGWQGTQVSALKRQARGNGISAPGHDALVIQQTTLPEISVDGFQISALWKRHEVVPACIAHQILDASFLPSCMHIGKKCFKAIHTLKMEKRFILSPTMSLQHLEHGRFEIVINSHAR